jgi:hypothetical protein
MQRNIVVVGAGLAGVSAARALVSRGHRVTVLEKSRGLGGRLATRRMEGATLDHGAAFFTLRDPAFLQALSPLMAAGEVRPWAERLSRWDGTRLVTEGLTSGVRRYACVGGMTAIVKRLAEGLEIERETKVLGLAPVGARWRVESESRADEADAVVLAIPAAQALALAETARHAVDLPLRTELGRVTFDPCLVLLATFDRPAPTWPALASETGAIQWIGVESSKRPAQRLALAIHASAALSRQSYDAPEEDVTRTLLAEAARMTGLELATPLATELKRWRFAKPVLLATARALLSQDSGPPLVACGDWCVAPRVEGAFQSGVAAAERLVNAGHA